MIIFGCGYVGRQLAREATEAGHEVWISSRNAQSLAQVEAVPNERKIIANLQEESWHGCFTGHWDVVYNLVSSAGGGIDGYRLSYLEGNRSLMKWADQTSVDRFVYTSATSVYPQVDGQWVDEYSVPDLDQLSPSGRILREAELEILAHSAIPERMILRLAGIYGPGRHLYLDRLRDGANSIPGDGQAWLNLIYLKDIVRALLMVGESRLQFGAEVYNVVDNKPSLKQEIVDWLALQLGMAGIPFDPSQQFARTGRRRSGAGLPNRRVSNRRFRERLRAGYTDILRDLQGSALLC